MEQALRKEGQTTTRKGWNAMKASMDQGKQILDLFSGSTTEQSQGVIEAGDLVKMLLAAPDLRTVDRGAFRDLLGINPYADEKTEGNYGYPRGYKPLVVRTQRSVLKKYYPDLDASFVDMLVADMRTLPEGAEQIQVVPKLSAVARLQGIDDPYGKRYGECVEIMLGHIGSTRNFYNYRSGKLTEKHIRLLAKTREWLEKLEAGTPGDFIVIALQVGKRWAGYSVRNGRFQMTALEIPMPSWVVGHHILTHPKREVEWEQLHMDCAGDEYSFDGDGQFGLAPVFSFGDGRLVFGARDVGDALSHCGSVSAFVRE
jgi:hypothetical protein